MATPDLPEPTAFQLILVILGLTAAFEAYMVVLAGREVDQLLRVQVRRRLF